MGWGRVGEGKVTHAPGGSADKVLKALRRPLRPLIRALEGLLRPSGLLKKAHRAPNQASKALIKALETLNTSPPWSIRKT